jgi:AcrR family transcriptional regulator
MPKTRSRPRTETKFIDAVVEHLGEKGCADLGVNTIAQRAGADKVLIYRYFNDLDGLLEQVARSIEWFPEAATYLPETEHEALPVLKHILLSLRQTFTERPASQQLLLWRKAVKNPLTRRFNSEWDTFWLTLAESLTAGQDNQSRSKWREACKLAALIFEAEIGGQNYELSCLERITADLNSSSHTSEPQAVQSATPALNEASLPTNLL